MNEALFEELLESVRKGATILQGKSQASRRFEIEPPDVKGIREQYKLTQVEFAQLMGISLKTLQNWEQGRRAPHGPARVLLQIAEKRPDAVWDVVREGQPTH